MIRKKNQLKREPDIVLIGAGIMSATLGVMLKELDPGMSIEIFERLDVAAAESSDAWNNAGTGHSAFCELNYTPENEDGSIDTSKAVKIAESFEVSKQFWAYLLEQNFLSDAPNFIRSIPHMSFVWGNDNVNFLKKRYEKLQESPLFHGMQYSDDFETLREWMPVVMEGREKGQKVAATKMDIGTDVNFGSLTRCMFQKLKEMNDVRLHFSYEVRDIDRDEDGKWALKVKNLITGKVRRVRTKFIFIGAGGGSLPLLLKSGIPEGKGFGGFPVSGQWLKCTNPEIVEKHNAKVYGKASVGAPPMSVPHLDTRFIDGKKALLFGPYAGFSTKFLKKGSYMDLPLSIKAKNIVPMVAAGIQNIPLTKYLIDQVRQSPEDRVDALREYMPDARLEDWELEVAGQRVQVIKKDPEHFGILEFGTEVVSAADGSIAALLGASPGASTAVSIMLTLLKKCFKDRVDSPEWQSKLKKMIPTYNNKSFANEPKLISEIRDWTSAALGLNVSESVL
jgi:malate dehydrogenase (quinone)